MSKRIVSIKIENFRAYYGSFAPIELNGQNLLIYGENGSGKSSLFKGLGHYIARSLDNGVAFIKNNYSPLDPGKFSVAFAEFDDTTFSKLPVPEEEYVFTDTDATTNNNVPFIRQAALIKGFLDYTDLLKVYLHEEPNPNLFELIVLSLLSNHIPISSGGTEPLGTKWKQLQDTLTVNSFNRNDNAHKRAIRDLPTYETQLRTTLNEVFAKLNSLLTTYFSELGLSLDYNLAPLRFNYGPKWNWHTTAILRLLVSKDGVRINGDYNDVLNEARLSAIAVCLYLAGLLVNPVAIDLKILYLDDVFVGLDAGNRLPILEIIRSEFRGYQIFISTYDRHWFELAKRQFELHENGKWSSIEVYVGKETIGGGTITKPIIVEGQTNYERAIKYLHNRTRPDFPAAANYFRKALEEDMSHYIPGYEKVDAEFAQIPDFQLTSLLKRLKKFLKRTGNSHFNVDKILGFLHILLHPLSHHDITSPIYKTELEILERAIADLKNELISLSIPTNYKNILGLGKILRMTFVTSANPNHKFYYELVLQDCLVVKNNGTPIPILSDADCNIVRMSEYDNGAHIKTISVKKSNLNFHYSSLKDLHDGSMALMKVQQPMTDPIDVLDQIDYHDGTSWQSLKTIIVW